MIKKWMLVSLSYKCSNILNNILHFLTISERTGSTLITKFLSTDVKAPAFLSTAKRKVTYLTRGKIAHKNTSIMENYSCT